MLTHRCLSLPESPLFEQNQSYMEKILFHAISGGKLLQNLTFQDTAIHYLEGVGYPRPSRGAWEAVRGVRPRGGGDRVRRRGALLAAQRQLLAARRRRHQGVEGHPTGEYNVSHQLKSIYFS